MRVDVIHFTCRVKTLCPSKEQYRKALQEAFPEIKIVIGTHRENVTDQEFQNRVRKLFCQQRKTMVDVILNKD